MPPLHNGTVPPPAEHIPEGCRPERSPAPDRPTSDIPIPPYRIPAGRNRPRPGESGPAHLEDTRRPIARNTPVATWCRHWLRPAGPESSAVRLRTLCPPDGRHRPDG